MEGCGRVMKYSLFFSNFVIFVSGSIPFNQFQVINNYGVCSGGRTHSPGNWSLDVSRQGVHQ